MKSHVLTVQKIDDQEELKAPTKPGEWELHSWHLRDAQTVVAVWSADPSEPPRSYNVY
jgi:hypothetical protein